MNRNICSSINGMYAAGCGGTGERAAAADFETAMDKLDAQAIAFATTVTALAGIVIFHKYNDRRSISNTGRRGTAATASTHRLDASARVRTLDHIMT